MEELSVITPQDLIKWFTFKLYKKETVDEDEVPTHGSHFSIDFYKKSISYFMPNKAQKWDPISNRGNPTRSKVVNAFINRIKDIDGKSGGYKKRKSLAGEDDSTSGTTPTKKRAGQLAVSTVSKGGIDGVLQRMHAQNVTLMNTFNTMSHAIESMKRSLQTNNEEITAEIKKMAEIKKIPTTTPASTSRLVDLCNVAEGAVASATKPSSFSFDPDIAFDSELGWHYVHPDGVKRRVPPSWQFPIGNIEEMYILWHCGDIQNRLSPMRNFTSTDVSFLGKRGKINLSELKSLINTVDEEAKRKGKTLAANGVTVSQALQSFQAGISALQSCAAAMTPQGRQRNIIRMKWSTLMGYVKNAKKSNELDPRDPEEVALHELVAPSSNDTPGDQWWYEHEDGIKRRVPSSYTFPMLSIEEMYVVWHCGLPEEKISPMRIFTVRDISFLMDRSRKNLSEVRTLMSKIDAEAARQAVPPTLNMTVEYARQCCRAGLIGLNFQSTTVSGRSRDIGQMKWSSVARNKEVKLTNQAEEEDEEEGVDDEKGEVEEW